MTYGMLFRALVEAFWPYWAIWFLGPYLVLSLIELGVFWIRERAQKAIKDAEPEERNFSEIVVLTTGCLGEILRSAFLVAKLMAAFGIIGALLFGAVWVVFGWIPYRP